MAPLAAAEVATAFLAVEAADELWEAEDVVGVAVVPLVWEEEPDTVV